MEFYSIASLILSLIVLIVFFIMSSNISRIKEILVTERKQDAKMRYYKFMATGNKEAAYDAMLDLVFIILTDRTFAKNERDVEYQYLKRKYQVTFEALGYSFPDNTFYQTKDDQV